jgi:fimbrial chaperone protein
MTTKHLFDSVVVENNDGGKDGRFVITPPLFDAGEKREYSAHYRCYQQSIAAGSGNAVLDERESYSSMDKSKLSDNTLQLAIISRIKLYYRPETWRYRRIRRRKADFAAAETR